MISDRDHMLGKIVKFGIPGLVAVVALLNSFYTVNQTERGVLTRFGQVVGVNGPGLHFKIPFAEGVRHINVANNTVRWNNRGRDGDYRMSSYSRDQQPADIAVTLTYHLPGDNTSIRNIVTRYGDRDGLYNAIVVPSATEALKNVFGTYDAVTAIQRRAELNREVLEAVRGAINGAPVVIDNVQIQDIEFSQAYEQAVEARMQAQVEVQRSEQQRQTRQIEADMTVITARANAESTRLAGEAQAQAIRARAEALRSSPELVQLTMAERWNGVLPQTMVPGAGVPMLNLPRTGN